MKIREYQVPVTIKTPYFTLNELTDQTRVVWLAFHGYGQLSRFFIDKFSILDPVRNFVIAPQGISRFYLEGFTGRVGASWMTKEDRLTEIENQYRYIDVVLQGFPSITKCQLYLFGFSQGVATMCRYAAYSKMPFRKMVLWAGTFPPELTRKDFGFLSGSEEVMYFTGDNDPFYEEGMKEQQQDLIRSVMGISPRMHVFHGNHQVISELLNGI